MKIAQVDFTAKFIKSLNKLSVKEQKLYLKKYEWFIYDAFDSRLKTHKLSGKLSGLWSFSVDYQYRVLFEFENESIVIFHNIGTHEIYK